ncbi:MAG: M48 family metallopeptidase [Desulfococcaceae bacterium]
MRVAAPLHLGEEAVRLAIVSRLGWIQRQRRGFARQERQSQREMVTGESHFFQGRRYRLDVVETSGRAHIAVVNNTTLRLHIPPGADSQKRRAVLERWYRRNLRERLPALVEQWEPVVGVSVSEARIKRMKTRWGSCNIEARRIWLNLELIKKPPVCLEYILVHEMVHLLERRHTDRFSALMSRFLPDWRLRRDELNRWPLAYEGWGY